ncbi:MAG: S24/S26 family peptidase, partial [Phycisphaerales bacterium]|nr:S24/S26 family peptidase [Phycisphaerales bacterium]
MPRARTTPTITTIDVARWIPLVRIRGRSMHPALAPGQILLTRPRSTGVAVGDVVVLTTTRGTLYVKRVAARAGDVVALE